MNEALARRRAALTVPARAAAFTTADAGADMVRLASDPGTDLLLVNGRRPLIGGGGVPAGAVGRVLRDAPCDVAALVEGEPREGPVMAPFGGAPHDWAAVELGAWLAVGRGVPLRLLGVPGASRQLADASLVIQQLAGIAPETALVEDVASSLEGAGLLGIGLSERYREEGLGPVRAEIARRSGAPVLFVRRGSRPGALAPSSDLTRFGWSVVGPPPHGGAGSR
jgi:hypothetical protein